MNLLFFFSDGLKLGGAHHWRDTLELITGEQEMSGEPLLEYFKPLYEYLKAENSNAKESEEESSYDPTIAIVAGSVVLGIVVVVCVGYVILRRRRLGRSNIS